MDLFQIHLDPEQIQVDLELKSTDLVKDSMNRKLIRLNLGDNDMDLELIGMDLTIINMNQ